MDLYYIYGQIDCTYPHFVTQAHLVTRAQLYARGSYQCGRVLF